MAITFFFGYGGRELGDDCCGLVGFGQVVQVVFHHFLFGVGDLEEAFV